MQSSCQKHLGVYLDQKLNFSHHIKEKVTKANKGIAVIKNLQIKIPRNLSLIIYKSFIRPYLNYADIINNQPNNNSFKNKLERNQYNAALATTGAIRGTPRHKTYKKLGLESLQSKRSLHCLCIFYNTKSNWPSILFV